MKKITIYTTTVCPYCSSAKALLSSKGLTYTEINVGNNEKARAELAVLSGGRKTVPQIFIGDYHVGGFDELSALNQQGKLDPILVD